MEEELIEPQEFETQEYKIDPKQEPMRIDKFLMNRIENATRTKIQNGIDNGWVLVNGKEIKTNHKIKPFDIVTVRWRKTRNADGIQAEDIALDIRYEDEDVLIIYKPAGLVVHPGVGNHNGTLANGLKFHLQEQDADAELPANEGKEGENRPGIVHRIDKNTTGLLVIAKTELAMKNLAKQFFDHTTERRYIALVWGNVEQDSGTIDAYIGRHPSYPKLRHVFKDGEEGKHAVTHYKVLQRFGYVTLVECQLETGRTHQIRVHFQHIGHPLFNDSEYGGDRIVKGTVFTKYKQFIQNCFKIMPHHCLHAQSLGFQHPRTGERIYLEAEKPSYFQDLLDKWENYTKYRT